MQPGRVNQGASWPCLEWNGSFLSLGGKYIEILSSASSISDTHTHSCACAHLHPTETLTGEQAKEPEKLRELPEGACPVPQAGQRFPRPPGTKPVGRASASPDPLEPSQQDGPALPQTPWNQASGEKHCPSGDGYQTESWLLKCYFKQEENLLNHRISESQKG